MANRNEAVLRDAVRAIQEAVEAIREVGDGGASMDDLGDRIAGSFARAGDLPPGMADSMRSIAHGAILADSELVALDVPGTLADMFAEGARRLERLRAAARRIREAEAAVQRADHSRASVEARQRDASAWMPHVEHGELQEKFAALNREVGELRRAADSAWVEWREAADVVQRRCRLAAVGPVSAVVQEPKPDAESGKWL